MATDFDPGTGLGPRLRLVRESRAISVRELARRVGCSASLISQVERGLSVPSVGILYSLASELDCSLDYVLFGVGTEAEPSGAGARARSGVAAGSGLAAGSACRQARVPAAFAARSRCWLTARSQGSPPARVRLCWPEGAPHGWTG